MKKSIVIVSSVIIGIIILLLGIQLYGFYHPAIEIGNAISETKTKEFIVVRFQEKSIFGMCASKKQQIEDFRMINDTLMNKCRELEGVYYINADAVLEPVGAGMKIIYECETYVNGENEIFYFEENVPFVLTYDFYFEGELITPEVALDLYKSSIK